MLLYNTFADSDYELVHLDSDIDHMIPETVNDVMYRNGVNRHEAGMNTLVDEIRVITSLVHDAVTTSSASSITCRPNYQTKVDEANDFLKYYAGVYKFVYIDNSCIKSEHINRRVEGVQLLSNNYLAHNNRPSYCHSKASGFDCIYAGLQNLLPA